MPSRKPMVTAKYRLDSDEVFRAGSGLLLVATPFIDIEVRYTHGEVDIALAAFERAVEDIKQQIEETR